MEAPLRTIVYNAGIEGSIVVQKVREGKGDFGYNARTDNYEKLLSAGVIDPTKVARVALENAASIAGMLLTTECVVADKPKKKSQFMRMAVHLIWVEWVIDKQHKPVIQKLRAIGAFLFTVVSISDGTKNNEQLC